MSEPQGCPGFAAGWPEAVCWRGRGVNGGAATRQPRHCRCTVGPRDEPVAAEPSPARVACAVEPVLVRRVFSVSQNRAPVPRAQNAVQLPPSLAARCPAVAEPRRRVCYVRNACGLHFQLPEKKLCSDTEHEHASSRRQFFGSSASVHARNRSDVVQRAALANAWACCSGRLDRQVVGESQREGRWRGELSDPRATPTRYG